jgi:hypothetical protein
LLSIPPNPREVNAANSLARLIAQDRGLWVTTLTLKRVRLCFKESKREPQPTFYVLTALAVAISWNKLIETLEMLLFYATTL